MEVGLRYRQCYKGTENPYQRLSRFVARFWLRVKTTIFVNQSAKLSLLRETKIGVLVRGIEAEHRTSVSPSLEATF